MATLAAPAPDAGFAPFAWDIPGIIEVVDVSGPMVSASIPVRASAVRTSWTGEPLVRHVLESFKRGGLFIVPPSRMAQLPGLPQLTGYDPDTRVSYTAMFQSNPDRTTTVILTEADLAARLTPPAGSVPLPPASSQVLRSTTEGSEVLRFQTRQSAAEVRAFYDGYARERGLVPDPGAGGDTAIYEGPHGALVLSLRPLDGGTAVTVIDRRGAAAGQNVQGEFR